MLSNFFKCNSSCAVQIAIALGCLTCALPGISLAQNQIARLVPTPHMQVTQLLKENKKNQALEYINNYLSNNPNDPQMLFWKAKILNESSLPLEREEAFQLYTLLTEDYPELAEPNNNLAVIFASKGDYTKAIHYFELALKANPGYAIASENLADLYVELALKYYQRAINTDPNNKTSKTKLDKITTQPTSQANFGPASNAQPNSFNPK